MSSTVNSKHYEMNILNESQYMKYDVWVIPPDRPDHPYRVYENICPGERVSIPMCYSGHIFSFIRSVHDTAPRTSATDDLPTSSRLKLAFDPVVAMYVVGKTGPWSFFPVYPPKPPPSELLSLLASKNLSSNDIDEIVGVVRKMLGNDDDNDQLIQISTMLVPNTVPPRYRLFTTERPSSLISSVLGPQKTMRLAADAHY